MHLRGQWTWEEFIDREQGVNMIKMYCTEIFKELKKIE